MKPAHLLTIYRVNIEYTYKLSEECGNKVIIRRKKNVGVECKEHVDTFDTVKVEFNEEEADWKVHLPNVFFFDDRDILNKAQIQPLSFTASTYEFNQHMMVSLLSFSDHFPTGSLFTRATECEQFPV